MSDNSKIEWTEATWNPVTGCTQISPGCAHCYAMRFANRFRGVPGHPYERGFDLQLRPERLRQPLEWAKPRRIFVNSMSDLFHDEVPEEYIRQVFDVMEEAEQHTFQVLTKRVERAKATRADAAVAVQRLARRVGREQVLDAAHRFAARGARRRALPLVRAVARPAA